MATGYFIQGPSAELEAVQRWENEGGRLSQNHGHVLDCVRDDHLRHQNQAMPTGRLAKRDASNNPKSITGWIPVGDASGRCLNRFSRPDNFSGRLLDGEMRFEL